MFNFPQSTSAIYPNRDDIQTASGVFLFGLGQKSFCTSHQKFPFFRPDRFFGRAKTVHRTASDFHENQHLIIRRPTNQIQFVRMNTVLSVQNGITPLRKVSGGMRLSSISDALFFGHAGKSSTLMLLS